MKTFFSNWRATAQEKAGEVIGHKPPWKAKSVWAALALTLLGGGLWVKDAAQQPPPGAAPPPGVSQFSETAPAEPGASRKSGLKPTSPAVFRLGASYLAGFFLGWGLRRFLKMTVLVAGGVIALIALLKYLGWFEVDWPSIEQHVRTSLTWLQGEAKGFKEFLTGYLPSATAAAVGAFLGFWRK